jgi:hypothetical protein
MGLQLTLSGTIMGLSAFEVLLLKSYHSEKFSSRLNVFLSAFGQIFFFCYRGEQIKNSCEKVLEKFYFTQWHHLKFNDQYRRKYKEVRCTLVNLMIAANRQKVLTGGGFTKLCMNTLVNV